MKKRTFRTAERDGYVFQRTREWACPACAAKVDSLGVLGKRETPVPKPDDVSLCIHCGQVLLFDDKLDLIIPHPGKLMMMRLADPEFSVTLSLLQARHRAAFPRN